MIKSKFAKFTFLFASMILLSSCNVNGGRKYDIRKIGDTYQASDSCKVTFLNNKEENRFEYTVDGEGVYYFGFSFDYNTYYTHTDNGLITPEKRLTNSDEFVYTDENGNVLEFTSPEEGLSEMIHFDELDPGKIIYISYKDSNETIKSAIESEYYSVENTAMFVAWYAEKQWEAFMTAE